MSANFAIVNMRDGIRRDVESFLPDDDAFPILENAYLFRGRIQKRSGFSPVGIDGRLKGVAGNLSGGGTITLLNGVPPLIIPDGTATFVVSGATLTDPGGAANPVVLLTTNPAITGTLNKATGLLTIVGAVALAPVTYIPGLPVMGLCVLETQNTTIAESINDEQLIAFDTRYSYLFDFGLNDYVFIINFSGVANNQFVWTGLDSDFFWFTNYAQAFWATNNTPGYHVSESAQGVGEGDGIRWYGNIGGITTPIGWSNFNPRLRNAAANYRLQGGLIILPYKNRLVVLNTLEGDSLATVQRFAQRARWCQNGTPFYGKFPVNGSAQADSWFDDRVGKGGFVDAPTSENIVSAEFIKDTLIVYFERSTWQLVYNYNETLPFVWQKINTELGCESTFSVVAFDRGVYAVGNYGIITTDSVNVVRLDQKIPDEVFNFQNRNQGIKRIHGIRDYTSQLVYWCFPVLNSAVGIAPSYDLIYPNQMLIYSYLDGSFSEFDDCFTCFGYFQKATDVTWAQATFAWNGTNKKWNSGAQQAKYPDVIAGNQRGFTMIISQLQGIGQNSPSIPIANIDPITRTITAANHNFNNNQYILITGELGITSGNVGGTPNGIVYKVEQATTNDFVVDQIDSADQWAGTYIGGGLLTHIPIFTIQTKEFNPNYQNGISIRLSYMDMFLENTDNGEFTAQFYTDDDDSNPIEEFVVFSKPEPMPTYSPPSPDVNFQLGQNKIWHRVYTNSFGSFIQNIFTLSDTQVRDLAIASDSFTLHGLLYYMTPSGRISYDI